MTRTALWTLASAGVGLGGSAFLSTWPVAGSIRTGCRVPAHRAPPVSLSSGVFR